MNPVINTTLSEAMRKSHAAARLKPAPTAPPRIIAIVGFEVLCNRLEASICPRKRAILSSVVGGTVTASPAAGGSSPPCLKSPPAQNALPAPVRMMTRTSGSCTTAPTPSTRRFSNAAFRALRLAGRFMVRVAMPSSFLISSTSSTEVLAAWYGTVHFPVGADTGEHLVNQVAQELWYRSGEPVRAQRIRPIRHGGCDGISNLEQRNRCRSGCHGNDQQARCHELLQRADAERIRAPLGRHSGG